MRNKTSLFKRSLAAVLCLVMVLGLIPVLGGGKIALEAEAAPVDTTGDPVGDYITLPITIRDFAADGMLFEYNEVDSSDTKTIGGTTTTYACEVNPEYWGLGQYTGDYTGIRVVVPNDYYDVFDDTYAAGFSGIGWYCVICDSDGYVLTVLDRSVDKKTTGIYENAMTTYGGAYSVWAWFNSTTDNSNYAVLEAITEENKGEYRLELTNANTGSWDSSYAFASTLAVTSGMQVFHQADTKGFGLMLTGSNDRIQNLTTTSGPGTYVSNGTYGSSTVPDPIDIVLNSGATQKGYGITIRKDLVGPTLVNGKPAYTQDTVTYLANYMSQIMNEPWQNADGSYNSFFVMGTKMFDENEVYVGPDDSSAVYDLAEILRRHVTGGLGDYDTTMNKIKANANALSNAAQCETWFDAAYYLLHYTWRDNPMGDVGNDGYGKPVSQYDSLHLVAKTQEDGSVYYVFNSGYNDTAYNPTTKEIFNTQTENITAAQDSTGDFYTRGIKLPAARFDPLGYSGTSSTGTAQWLGYGPNAGGNTYGDLVGSSATQLWDDYYDTTNYHLSLEGHAEFVFHYSSDLYFTFTGDDDVYLYINGVRVLDLGAAHSIVKAQINLNDVAELCGLKEGEPARFDFFYLERHGTAANFGIETNIQLAQSGMITTKQGYQNGVSTGYDGPVDPSKPVAYSFTLKNAGDATLEHLTFKDEKLGVSLSEYNIDLGDKLDAGLEAMYVYVRNENDAIVRFYSATTETPLSEAVLMEELKTGLPAGYSMTIYNFRYKISDDDWALEGGKNFTNVVNTTAIANGKQVAGTADWKVHKADLLINPFHIYNWVNKDLDDTEWQSRDVELTKAELTQPAVNAKSDLDVSGATIVLCNGSGNENSALWSEAYTNIVKNITWGENYTLTYNSKTPGLETVYYKVKGIGYDDLIYHFDVITYGAANNVYVLDYGLAVELNCDQYGFRVNDHLTVPQNIHAPNTSIYIRPQESNYGDFVFTHKQDKDENGAVVKDYGIDPISASVQYVPDEFMSGADSFKAEIVICEPGKALSKFTGVTMEEYVITAPANVVYYEENFPGITYVSEGENQWVHYETMDGGESTAGTNQSPDQDSNYGSDPNYAEDKVGVLESDGPVENTLSLNLDTSDLNAVQKLGIAALNAYFGLGGGDSNGTVNKLEVKQTAEVMYFDFEGTGFELISRTTSEEYAIINVQVQKYDEETKTYTVYKQLPVITESVGGDLYQIPVISITGLPKDKYHVVIQAGTTGNVNRVFYVDGIRIYGPLEGNDLALEYYNPAEYEAEFHEVKQMIEDGKMIYGELFDDPQYGLKFYAGYTMVENTSEMGAVLMPVYDINEYMSVGPNNELYMDPNSTINVLTFTVKPKANYPDAARTLQIGAHRKANSNIPEGVQGAALMTYAVNPQDIYDRTYAYWVDGIIPEEDSYMISSGTEMYYTIDLDGLTPDANGNYVLTIAAIGSESGDTNLALTNLKVAGYEIAFAETAIQTAADEGNLDDQPMVAQTFAVLRAVREMVSKVPEVEQVPVNENLVINSAGLSVSKVVSGRPATLTVKTTNEAAKLVVLDAEGNEVTATRLSTKVSNGVVTYTFTWKVSGTSGQQLNYTVRVYDAEGLASVNTETVTVTIR